MNADRADFHGFFIYLPVSIRDFSAKIRVLFLFFILCFLCLFVAIPILNLQSQAVARL